MRHLCRWSGRIFGLTLILNFKMAYGAANVQQVTVPTLSDEQKAGQMMMIGISGKSLSQRTLQHLEDLQPGSVLLFQHNIGNGQGLGRLTSAMQNISRKKNHIPLLIAADQEGGRVCRVDLFPKMPSPLAVGRTGDSTLARDLSFRAGEVLRDFGINMNLAPVMDTLHNDTDHSFIGERSFGWKTDVVEKMGAAFAEGQLLAGVIPTSKHFPGSGGATADPHAQPGSVGASYSMDSLAPFKEFTNIFPSAMMLSHYSYPNLDASGLPATLSKTIVTNLLRHEMGFNGLVITDDLPMGAVKKYGKLPELAVMSIAAGADMVMVSWGPKEQLAVRKRIAQAIHDKEISPAAVDEHLRRIFIAKRFIATHRSRALASSLQDSGIKIRSLADIEQLILQSNVQRDLNKLPSISTNTRWGIISTKTDFQWGFERGLGKGVLKQTFKNLVVKDADLWVVELDSPKMAIDLGALSAEDRKKILIVNELGPGWIQDKKFFGVLNLHHHHESAGRLIAEKLKSGWAGPPTSVVSQIAN